MLSALKRFILWEYERGCWQYDVMCGLIAVFVALTPRLWSYHDQPRIPQAAQITSLPAHGESMFFIDAGLVGSFPEAERLARVGRVLSARIGRKVQVTRLDPIYDAEQEPKGYMAFARP